MIVFQNESAFCRYHSRSINGKCSWQVMSKLIMGTPQIQLVDAYLTEIAKAYGIPWSVTGETAAVAEDPEDEVRNSS